MYLWLSQNHLPPVPQKLWAIINICCYFKPWKKGRKEREREKGGKTSPFCCLLFRRSVVSSSLGPHGLQHARPPCPSLSPRACSNSCPLSRWYYPTISSSVAPFSSCLHFSEHQGLFQWVGSSLQVAKSLELQLQHQPFQWIFRVDFFRIDWTVEIRKSLFSRHWIRGALNSQKCI